jgi:hypothetical protein
MKIFISWAKDGASHEVARVLHDWLACVIQAAQPFVSDLDIGIGARWSEELADQLRDTDCGIVCVTASNINSAWLNWEAGAISKGGDKALIIPFLFGADRSEVGGPLEQFQFAECNEESILRLVRELNSKVEVAGRMSETILKKTFDHWWPELRENLGKIVIPSRSEPKPGYSWLFCANDLSRRQGSEYCKEVWVVTPDLRDQALSDDVTQFLRKNLGRGVIYKYIVPETEASVEAKRDLEQYLSDCRCIPEVVMIDEHDFYLQAPTNYILLNPRDSDVETFLELPIDKRGIWIKVSTSAALNFADRFQGLVEKTPIPAQIS